MSSIDYPPLVECCNLGQTTRMASPESIGLRRCPGAPITRGRFSSYAEPEKVSSLRLFAGDLDFGISSDASLRITDVIIVVQFNLEHDELLLLAGTDPLGRRLLTTAVAATR